MTNQKSLSLPSEWQERFWLKYIGADEPLLLTKKTRDAVLQAMANGAKYVQIKDYTIMVNSIQAIEPYYSPDNIPPRPDTKNDWGDDQRDKTREMQLLWDETYGNGKLLGAGQ